MNRTNRLPIPAMLIVATLFSGALQLSATDVPSLDGHWEGHITIQGAELGMLTDFAPGDAGGWTGTIDIPLQGANGLPLVDISVAGPAVTFAIQGLPGSPTFRGTLAPDGKAIAGDLTQWGQTFPFRLENRATRPGAEALKKTREQEIEGFRDFVKTAMADWKVPGVAVAIIEDDKVILSEGFGLREVKGGLPVTTDTLFAIGSSTKAFTTALLGMLVDEDKLEWDEPLITYLPSFKVRDEYTTHKMTPRDLVTHRSGLPRHDLMWYGSPFSRKEIFDRLRYLEPNKEFRAEFQYQNLMFMAAGYLAGELAGTPWEELIARRIFAPLGMTSSNFSVEISKKAGDYALPYEENQTDGKVVEIPFRDVDAVGPAGSINSNVADMTRWLRLHLAHGRIGDKQVISQATLSEIHSPQIVVPANSVTAALLAQKEMPHVMYAMGWFVQPYRGHEMIHHGGNIDGFSALVSFMPDDRIGTVVLTNLSGTALPLVLALTAYDRLLGLEPTDWNGRYKLVTARFKEAQKQAEKQKDLGRKEGTQPSHATGDYAGEYENPGYGALQVSASGKSLKIAYNGTSCGLTHWHYDVFRAAQGPIEGLKFSFLNNVRGDVDRVSAPLEASVAEIVFTRKPPASMFEPAFLKSFVGDYDLMGTTVRIALRGDRTLTVTVPAQPTYDLEPYQGSEFDFKALPGYSVRFVLKEGKVSEAIFIQPNGTFLARRMGVRT